MPHYEHECQDCGHINELFRTVSKRNDPAVCEKCGSSNTRRKIECGAMFHRGIPGQGINIKYADGSGMSTNVRKHRSQRKVYK